MSGFGQLWIPPSGISVGPLAAGTWERGIPIPLGGISGPIATPQNMLSASPPTLLEEFQIVTYAVAWGVISLENAAGTIVPTVTFELALLVNGRVSYVTQQVVDATGTATAAQAKGFVTGDLVNPISLGARDRLSIQIGLMSNQATTGATELAIAQQYNADFTASPQESTISYNVLALPAARRL